MNTDYKYSILFAASPDPAAPAAAADLSIRRDAALGKRQLPGYAV
jgi:hypothetical protein